MPRQPCSHRAAKTAYSDVLGFTFMGRSMGHSLPQLKRARRVKEAFGRPPRFHTYFDSHPQNSVEISCISRVFKVPEF